MKSVQISAVIITFNEERNIGRCLESLVGVADEIVVVDSYSTDRTREICSSFGVRFIHHKFCGYIEQRNWAVLQATSPYVLSLDADESLSEALRDSILDVKASWEFDGYSFNRLNNYCGKWIRHTSWYPDRKLRLWNTRKGKSAGINPHDRIHMDKGSSQSLLKGDLLHYSYYTVQEHMKQINNFSTIIARSYYKAGKPVFISTLVIHPLWRFIRDFFIKGGFLDGYYGWVVSKNSSYEVFLKYKKLRKLYKDN